MRMSPSGPVAARCGQKPAIWVALLASIAVGPVSPPDLPQCDGGGDGYQASREVLGRLFAALTRRPAAIPGLREGRLLSAGTARPWNGGAGPEKRYSIEPRKRPKGARPSGGSIHGKQRSG